MKKTITYLLFMGVAIFLTAQSSIQNDVISSAGTSASSASMKIDYSVGEPVIETATATNINLTQGFHQPSLTITSIEEADALTDISCYPNPVNDELIIDVSSQYTELLIYTIYDINGKILSSERLNSGTNTINMQSYAVGNYLLQIKETSSGRTFDSKILKIK